MDAIDVHVWLDCLAKGQEKDLVSGMYPFILAREAAEKVRDRVQRKGIIYPAQPLGHFLGQARGSIPPFKNLDLDEDS